jgi:putative colanic acid biosynthesis acetyltransferase WcaF
MVAPGVQVFEGAVLGLGAVATRDLEPWTVYSGNPAQRVRDRVRHPDEGIAPNQHALDAEETAL